MQSGQIRSNKIGQIQPNNVGQIRPVKFGQMWSRRMWLPYASVYGTWTSVKDVCGARSTSANFDFGQLFFFFFRVRPTSTPANFWMLNFGTTKSGAPKGGGPGGQEGWGPEGWRPEGWRPEISRFFFSLSRHSFHSSLPLLGVLSWNFGGPEMCTFGVLGLSCEAPAVGFRGSGFREKVFGDKNKMKSKMRKKKKNKKKEKRKREENKRKQKKKKPSKHHLFDFSQFRLRPISTSASWPKSNWRRSRASSVCVWAAVDDEIWNQFAGGLGDVSLQNLSLFASMQPGDIKEAIEATALGVVGRTKLRLVHAATRLKFDLDPIDVGAPSPTVAAEPVVVVGPRGGTSCLKVKVATWTRHRIGRSTGCRWRSSGSWVQHSGQLKGMKAEEVTNDQLSVIFRWGRPCVWRPFGQRVAKSMRFVSHFLDSSGSWWSKEIPGPDSLSSWEACWRVFRTADSVRVCPRGRQVQE